MSVSVESFVTHRISLKIPKVVLRDSIAHLLMNHFSEELRGADLEVLLDVGDNHKEARRQLTNIAAQMVQPFVDSDDYGVDFVAIPFCFIAPASP